MNKKDKKETVQKDKNKTKKVKLTAIERRIVRLKKAAPNLSVKHIIVFLLSQLIQERQDIRNEIKQKLKRRRIHRALKLKKEPKKEDGKKLEIKPIDNKAKLEVSGSDKKDVKDPLIKKETKLTESIGDVKRIYEDMYRNAKPLLAPPIPTPPEQKDDKKQPTPPTPPVIIPVPSGNTPPLLEAPKAPLEIKQISEFVDDEGNPLESMIINGKKQYFSKDLKDLKYKFEDIIKSRDQAEIDLEEKRDQLEKYKRDFEQLKEDHLKSKKSSDSFLAKEAHNDALISFIGKTDRDYWKDLILDTKEQDPKKRNPVPDEKLPFTKKTLRANKPYLDKYALAEAYLMSGHDVDLTVKFNQFVAKRIDELKKQHGSGKEKEKELPAYLSNIDIDKVMSKYPEYLGTISSDEIPTRILPNLRKGQTACFIINTDPSDRPGQHWVAFFLNPKKDGSIEYYDSFAEPIHHEWNKFLKPMADIISPDSYLKFKSNKIVNQSVNSSNCGYFAIKFLVDRLRGKPFKEVTNFDLEEDEIENFKDIFPRFKYIM
jgi:hypothetical protein